MILQRTPVPGFLRRAFVASLGLLPLGTAAAAQSSGLARLVPEDSVFFLRVPDLSATRSEIGSLPLARLYREKEVRDFLAKPLGLAEEGLAQWRSKSREAIGLDPGTLAEVRFRGVEFALTRLRPPSDEGSEPEIGLALRVDAGPDFARVAPFLEKAKEEAAKHGGRVEEVDKGGKRYVVLRSPEGDQAHVIVFWPVAGPEVFAAMSLAAPGPVEEFFARATGPAEGSSLEGDPDFRAAMSRVAGDASEVAGFLRVSALFDAALSALALLPEGVPEFLAPDRVRGVLDALGLRGVRALAFASTIDGEASRNDFFFVAPAPRSGLLALAEGRPIDPGRLRLAPKEAVSFSVGHLDAGALWDTLLRALDALGAEASSTVHAALEAFEKEGGVDLRRELVGSVEGGFVTYSLPARDAMSGMAGGDAVGIVDLRDAASFEKAIAATFDALLPKIGILDQKVSEYEGVKIRTLALKPGAAEIPPQFAMAVGMLSPSFAVRENRLLLSLNRDGLKRAIRRLGQDLGEGAGASEGYQRFAARVPKDASSVGYSDPRPGIEMVYGMASSFLPMLGAGGKLPVDFNALPSGKTLTKHLFGSVSYQKADAAGIHWRSYSPWGVDTAYAALCAGVGAGALWSVERQAGPRGRAGRVTVPESGEADPAERAKHDLLDLRSALTVYKIENDGYPPALDRLLATSPEYPDGLLPGRKEIPKDPWGRAYVYEPSSDGQSYRLRSVGPNGQDEGGEGDDVVGGR